MPKEYFRVISSKVSNWFGSPIAFSAGLAIIAIWAFLGPKYQWSDTHSLFINTFTTIITFLAVFLIQNTQNRDSKALHLKLDEVIRAARGARNHFIDLENMSDAQVEKLQEEFKRVCKPKKQKKT